MQFADVDAPVGGASLNDDTLQDEFDVNPAFDQLSTVCHHDSPPGSPTEGTRQTQEVASIADPDSGDEPDFMFYDESGIIPWEFYNRDVSRYRQKFLGKIRPGEKLSRERMEELRKKNQEWRRRDLARRDY